MLILTRRVGEVVMIGNDVTVTVLGVKGNQVRIGVNAPRDVAVHREEIFERIKREVDPKSRNALIEQALLLSHQDVSHIPLHNQVIPWAMKKNIDLYHRADNRIDMRSVKVN